MQNSLFIKSTGLLFIALLIGSILFTSANTKEAANQQSIATLSAELADMKAEMALSKESESMQLEAYYGEIRMFSGYYAPQGWAFCNGQLLEVSRNDALFSILGTTYGGDGRTTFGLPDLRGRVPVHAGGGNGNPGPGLETIVLGQKGGSEMINVRTVKGAGTGSVDVVSKIGSSNHQPYQGVNFIIALEGIYPSRN